MTLAKIIDTLKMIALKHPNVNSAYEGNIYDILNAKPDNRYASVVITQQSHTTDEIYDHYGFVIFYVDRLVDDLEENRVQIQSIGKSMLGNIITAFCNNFDAECDNISFQPFTQRFADECAGVYCTITIDIIKDSVCPEEYWNEDWVAPVVSIRNQNKSVVFTENGSYTIDYDVENYTGLGVVQVEVNIPLDEIRDNAYSEGFNNGREDGYNSGRNDGYGEGKTDGANEQKLKLETINITENGTYSREDGYNTITVEVPDINGSFDEGYQSGMNDGYNEGFSKGVEEGVSNAGEIIAETARVLEVTENGTYVSKFSEIEWDEPVTGVYNDGTEFYSYANLETTVFDTGIPATQDSKLEFWWKNNDRVRVNGTVVGGQHYDGHIFKFVEYSKNVYKIEFGNYKVGKLFTYSFEYDMTSKWAHISLSKKDGLVVDGQLICTIDGEKWGDNQAIPNFWINTSYDEEMGNTADGSFGMIKINDTVIIPTKDGFLNTTTNELLTKVASGTYEYKNLEVPVAEGDLIKTVKVNVPQKISPNKYKVCFAYSSFKELPEGLINWNSVTDMQQMFRECTNLQSLNVESKELLDIGYAFYNCSYLSDLTIDTSNVTSLYYAFYGCRSLPNKFFETLNTSNVTTMYGAFQNTSIETFPSLDTSNVTNMYGMLQGTYSTLKRVMPINTSKVTDMGYMFYDFSGVSVLEELPEFDCSNVKDMSRMFSYYQDRMPNFTTCGGWKNLSCNWNDNYGLRSCANLSYQSCINILNGLADVTALGGRTLKVHQNFLNLVGDEISIGTAKGWQITA